MIMQIIGIRKKKVAIISIYNKESWKIIEEKFEKILGDMEDEELVIKNFNVRGELDSVEWGEEEIKMRNKDEVIRNREKELIDWSREGDTF